MISETGRPDGDVPPEGESASGDEVSPDDVDARGTLFFLGVYLMLLLGMWGAMYWIMVTR